MNGLEGILILIGFAIFLGFVFLFAAASFDKDRVRQYFRRRGEQLLDIRWAPFGPGWLGEKESRIYHVRFKDQEGRTHSGHVKTSMWSGVYLTNDHVDQGELKVTRHPVSSVPNVPSLESIEMEKARLRRRLAELEEFEKNQ